MAASSSMSAKKQGSASTAEAAGTAADPVCLLDSDSSDDDDDDCQLVASSNNNNNGGGGKSKAKSKAKAAAGHDDANTVRGTAGRRKRPASATAHAIPSSARANAAGNTNGTLADRFVPFRMYTTSNDLRPSSANGASSASASSSRPPFTSTLREMIGLDSHPTTTSSTHNHNHNHSMGSLKFLIIYNYLIDFDFLLDEIPELLSLDRTIILYGHAMNPTGPAQLQSLLGTKLTTIQLVPSDPPTTVTNPTNNPLPFRMEYGVHHTKMFLVGYEHGMRVVIHTSNLRASDFGNNAQCGYVQDFPIKTKFLGPWGDNKSQSQMVREHCDSEDSYALSCPFEEELIRYLDSYRQTARYVWPLDSNSNSTGSGGGGANKSAAVPLLLTEVLRRYDYSAAYGVLIPSVPGYHRLRNCPWGHLRLRDAIRAHTTVNNDDNDDGGDGNGEGSGTTSSKTGNILLQFSSLGSISLKWLHELASSMDVRAARSPLQRLSSGAHQSSSLLDKIQIVWPTFEEVRTAAAGYAAGGPIPGRVKNTDKPFLRRFYHRWSSEEDPMRKKRHPGHCKTFLQLGTSSDDEDDDDGTTSPTTTVEWCLVTSHNLSTAALGQIQNNTRMGEQCLFIRHWELGVFVSPDTLQGAVARTTGGSSTSLMAKKLKSEDAGGNEIASAGTCTELSETPKVRMVPYRGVDANYEENDVILPLPFDVRPTRYSSQDVPWATDRHGGLPDAFGRVLG